MMKRERKLILIDFLNVAPIEEEKIEFGGMIFHVTKHNIGWRFDLATSLIQMYDGFADGFCISGIQRRLTAGKTKYIHPGYLRLLKHSTRTSLYVADEIRDLFAEWTFRKIHTENPNFFLSQKVLFLGALVNPLFGLVANAGASVSAADSMVVTGVPKLLHGIRETEIFLKILSKTMKAFEYLAKKQKHSMFKPVLGSKLISWIQESNIFVSFGAMIDKIPDLSALQDKILITDYISQETRARLEEARVGQVIELIPSHPDLENLKSKHFSILTAMLDQKRLLEDSKLSFDEYVLQWIQDSGLKANTSVRRSTGALRCAFVIHPLSQKDLLRVPAVGPILKALPRPFLNRIESIASKFPVFHCGTLVGAKSLATGQEVICDLYAMPATPRELMRMPEEFVYDRMVEAAKMAQARGATMMGLGAYTKVIGDAGVTVSKRSPIPVTNGNSFSASTTLWAAREMMDRIGMATPGQITAMIIGATGSIGRVSSLLTSLVVSEVILVATRPDKLLELREEIKKTAPHVKVKVTTQPGNDIGRCDLIVTATSSAVHEGRSVIDIMQVKPGAVICDCSRPLDISFEDAQKRPDVMVIESGEVLLPGNVSLNVDIGLPPPSVYACLAETVLLTMEGRFESFSLSKQLSMEKVKEIYKIAVKHGAKLAEAQGPFGTITDEDIEKCRNLAKKGVSLESKVLQ